MALSPYEEQVLAELERSLAADPLPLSARHRPFRGWVGRLRYPSTFLVAGVAFVVSAVGLLVAGGLLLPHPPTTTWAIVALAVGGSLAVAGGLLLGLAATRRRRRC